MTIIGSKDLDEKIFQDTLRVENLTDEQLRAQIEEIEAEIGEIEIPKLEADKYTPEMFYLGGKLHPRFDEIWEYVEQGTDETPEEIMAKFDA